MHVLLRGLRARSLYGCVAIDVLGQAEVNPGRSRGFQAKPGPTKHYRYVI